MPSVRSVGVLLAVASVGATGCGLLRTERPVTVRVIDGDTGRPAEGVPVTASYRHMLDFTAPLPTTATTDPDGLVTLRVAAYDTAAVEPDLAWNPTGGFKIGSKRLRGLPDRPTGEALHTFAVYPGPRAEVELVVPVGYRGPVMVRSEATDELTAGRRRFSFAVAPTGQVLVRGPQLLSGCRQSPEVTACSADGSPFPDDYLPGTVRLRYVAGHRETQLYVVGTEADKKALHDAVYPSMAHPYSTTRTFDAEVYERLFTR